MKRLVMVNGRPEVATVEKDGFRLEHDPVTRTTREVWSGRWRATIGAEWTTRGGDTVEEACDAAACEARFDGPALVLDQTQEAA